MLEIYVCQECGQHQSKGALVNDVACEKCGSLNVEAAPEFKKPHKYGVNSSTASRTLAVCFTCWHVAPTVNEMGFECAECNSQYEKAYFDSRAEMRRFPQLVALLNAGEIGNLILHPSFELAPKINSHVRAIHYEADFQYTDHRAGTEVVEDVKGAKTKEYRIKANLFVRAYPQYEYRVLDAKDV